MTEKEIDAMEAGREMDAVIAEKVMGWLWCVDVCTYNSPGYEYGKLSRFLGEPERYRNWWRKWDSETEMPIQGLFQEESSVPEYSTDIGAAWLVVEKIGLSVVKISEGWQARRFVAMRDSCASNATTAPLAICRAALKATLNCHKITTNEADEPATETG